MLKVSAVIAALSIMLAVGANSVKSQQQAVACPGHGTAHPQAPAALNQFAFLVGDFEIKGRSWTGEDWGKESVRMKLHGRYILGGMAIMDERFDAASGEALGGGRGVSVRMFDEEEGIWKLMGQHTKDSAVVEMRSKMIGGKLHVWRVHPNKDDHLVFYEVTDGNHWSRVTHTRSEDGTRWIPQFKMEAKRLPCSQDKTAPMTHRL